MTPAIGDIGKMKMVNDMTRYTLTHLDLEQTETGLMESLTGEYVDIETVTNILETLKNLLEDYDDILRGYDNERQADGWDAETEGEAAKMAREIIKKGL